MKQDQTIITLHNLLDYDASKFTTAEIHLRSSLHEWIILASSLMLKAVLQRYLEYVEKHIKMMEGFFEEERMNSLNINNRVMEAFIEEANEKLSYCTGSAIKDACLLASIQAINHYKISAYGTAAAFTNLMGMESFAIVFHEAEVNEKKIDDRLSQLAEHEINLKAKTPVALEK